MKDVITGNDAAAYGASLSRAQVIPAYPITPQTSIIETIADLISQKKLVAKYIPVESEHSAMAACIGASFSGARTFTATSSQGLLLMHEVLHWAGLARLPIVMVNVNRAVAPGWSIWTDQNDSLSQRDTGWIQLYCENNQEVLDSTIQAFKIAETVNLPLMIVLDAFFLSHTSEIVDIPSQKEVDDFLPPYKPKFKLDVENPCAFGGLVGTDIYEEFRYNQNKAMEETLDIASDVDKDWEKRFGRSWGLTCAYKTRDAEIVLVTSATLVSTARTVVDKLREGGKKVGLLKIRFFRPFPRKEVRNQLAGIPKVVVLDRNISPGHHGIFHQELKSALFDLPEKARPKILGVICGLGGRDITPNTIEEVFNNAERWQEGENDVWWVGLRL